MAGPRTRLRLRISPGASRAGIAGRYGDAWKVRVSSAPERGKANQAVLELLSGALALPRSRLELVTGHRDRDKVVAVDGLTADEVERRLTAAAASV